MDVEESLLKEGLYATHRLWRPHCRYFSRWRQLTENGDKSSSFSLGRVSVIGEVALHILGGEGDHLPAQTPSLFHSVIETFQR